MRRPASNSRDDSDPLLSRSAARNAATKSANAVVPRARSCSRMRRVKSLATADISLSAGTDKSRFVPSQMPPHSSAGCLDSTTVNHLAAPHLRAPSVMIQHVLELSISRSVIISTPDLFGLKATYALSAGLLFVAVFVCAVNVLYVLCPNFLHLGAIPGGSHITGIAGLVWQFSNTRDAAIVLL